MIIALIASALATVNLVECPKCDKRMRILDDGTANVNVCRLKDDAPDAKTLDRRIAKMKARAEAFLRRGAAKPTGDFSYPLMGWSSWNTFGVSISEDLILETARAMATNGLAAAGYAYVNIDDGFFGGRDEKGQLLIHKSRFPNGLKPVADGIHALGLKAGIYSEAGADTCGSMWSKDPLGKGSGLYGHDAADCKLFFDELDFDFIKIDYCGGQTLKLDERKRYFEIAAAIRAAGRKNVRFNICRWAFPGTWAADIAESWRTTGDIRANWKKVSSIIGENLYLSAYAKPGHYNDMDMLEVGQYAGKMKTVFGKHLGDTGLTEDEERTHFGVWCMLSSPLLIGCDVRTIPATTKALITNPYLIAVNQNVLGQAIVAQRRGECYVLVKDADKRFGLSRYVAVCNLGEEPREVTVEAKALDLAGEIDAFDLVEKADIGAFADHVTVKLRPHESKFFRFDAARRLMRTVYEAETAYLSDYQELRRGEDAGTAFPSQSPQASGGVLVRYLGNRATNDLVWRAVKVDETGDYELALDYMSHDNRSCDLQIDDRAPVRVETPATTGRINTVKVAVRLEKGLHRVRLSNEYAWAADFDRMVIRKK